MHGDHGQYRDLYDRLYFFQIRSVFFLATIDQFAKLFERYHRRIAGYLKYALSHLHHFIVCSTDGVGGAIYLNEYATSPKLVKVIEYCIETLAGIPSIIFGLVGMLVFCQFFGLKTSLLAGSLTLVIMNLPTIIRTTQESLKTVPQGYREGAFGLGAAKWHVIRTVILPCCIEGIVTGCILSIGRMLGESAALLFTAGFAHTLNGYFEGMRSAGSTLTVALYVYAKEQGEFEVAFVIAAILLFMSLLINLLATFLARRVQKRMAS